jgi:hypothetical protein
VKKNLRFRATHFVRANKNGGQNLSLYPEFGVENAERKYENTPSVVSRRLGKWLWRWY